ncbi:MULTISPECIES: hypothetical protein [unclassified Paenarthrobacter]|uniref:hypothetical protein n=1 Tax=unclassified Paenarthrobacter TaxID=2634190 RepID=UPI003CE68EA5
MFEGTENLMDGGARPSAALMAVIVFCLAVLLGIGGTAAFALWEQGHGSPAHQSADSVSSP